MKKIVIIAGDKSADTYGGFLAQKIKAKSTDVEIYSFGGHHLAAHTRQLNDLTKHSVTGLFEVLRKLPKLWQLFQSTVRAIDEIKPDLVIPIDLPDFNIRLIKKLKLRYPVFYYISPQVWAWRKNRVKTLKEYVTKMVVIFKFEQAFYKDHGMEVLYFGHPLLEIIPKTPVATKKIITFMPGSRKNEISRHLPLLVKTKEILETKLKGYEFRIIRPANVEKSFYENYTTAIPVIDHSYERIAESSFIITCSGTATIELAILNVPFLIIYKAHPLTWHIVKKMVHAQFAGMVNILAGYSLVEELLQDKANPETIAHATLTYLNDTSKYSKLKTGLHSLQHILSPMQSTEKFADYILEFLDKSH